jgi:hypothetical protein
VRVFINVACNGVGALLQTVVAELVHDNMIPLLEQSTEDSVAGEPPSRVDHHTFDLPKDSELFPKLPVIFGRAEGQR